MLSFTTVLSSLSKILLSRTLGRMVLMVSDSVPICFSHLLLHRTEIRALYSPLPGPHQTQTITGNLYSSSAVIQVPSMAAWNGY